MGKAIEQAIQQRMVDHITGLIGDRLYGPYKGHLCQYWKRETKIGLTRYVDSIELALFGRELCYRLYTGIGDCHSLSQPLFYKIPDIADPSFKPLQWLSLRTAPMLKRLEQLAEARVKFETIASQLMVHAQAILGGEFKSEAECIHNICFEREIKIGGAVYYPRIELNLDDCYFEVHTKAGPHALDNILDYVSPSLVDDGDTDFLGLLDAQLRLALRGLVDFVERVRKGQPA